jgi:hypothetical protein
VAGVVRRGDGVNRRTLHLAIVGFALCLGAYLFTQNYAFVKDRVWVGMSGEARVNRLLAARMLLTRMGSRVQESSDLSRLDQFPVGGTIFLAADRGDLDSPTAARLLAWVKDGGHLVVAAERPVAHDPLLDMLGISVQQDDVQHPTAKADDVELPDGTHLRVDLIPSPRLFDDDDAASWSHESHDAIRILQIPYEDGLVTVMSTFRPFGNYAIGHLDHAELLWRLASDDGHPPDVWLVRHVDTQSLPRWLVKNALPFVVALGVFLTLALWRVIPRFGPLQPNPEPDRRSLVEHLAAMGRFYSMQRQLPRLVQVVRQDGLDLLGARAPETRGQDATARLKTAARLTGLRPRELLQAFTGVAATAHDFTQAVRVLAAFRRQLAYGKTGDRRRSRARYPDRPASTDRRRDHKMRAEFDKAFHAPRKVDKEHA